MKMGTSIHKTERLDELERKTLNAVNYLMKRERDDNRQTDREIRKLYIYYCTTIVIQRAPVVHLSVLFLFCINTFMK